MDHYSELDYLKKKNAELAQANAELGHEVQHYKRERVELLRDNSDLRLALNHVKNEREELKKLDAQLKALEDRIVANIVNATSLMVEQIGLRKVFMARHLGADAFASPQPRRSTGSGTTAQVRRVPPHRVDGQIIQPVVTLSRTLMDTSARIVNQNNNNQPRRAAFPMNLLQDVYIPLTRIDQVDGGQEEVDDETSGDDIAMEGNEQAPNDSREDISDNDNALEESKACRRRRLHLTTRWKGPQGPVWLATTLSSDETRGDDVSHVTKLVRPHSLSAIIEESGSEGMQLTSSPISRSEERQNIIDNPIEGPSWLLDHQNSRVSDRNLEADSTTGCYWHTAGNTQFEPAIEEGQPPPSPVLAISRTRTRTRTPTFRVHPPPSSDSSESNPPFLLSESVASSDPIAITDPPILQNDLPNLENDSPSYENEMQADVSPMVVIPDDVAMSRNPVFSPTVRRRRKRIASTTDDSPLNDSREVKVVLKKLPSDLMKNYHESHSLNEPEQVSGPTVSTANTDNATRDSLVIHQPSSSKTQKLSQPASNLRPLAHKTLQAAMVTSSPSLNSEPAFMGFDETRGDDVSHVTKLNSATSDAGASGEPQRTRTRRRSSVGCKLPNCSHDDDDIDDDMDDVVTENAQKRGDTKNVEAKKRGRRREKKTDSDEEYDLKRRQKRTKSGESRDRNSATSDAGASGEPQRTRTRSRSSLGCKLPNCSHDDDDIDDDMDDVVAENAKKRGDTKNVEAKKRGRRREKKTDSDEYDPKRRQKRTKSGESRDSRSRGRDASGGRGAESEPEGASRRRRRQPVQYKEVPLNRKLRR